MTAIPTRMPEAEALGRKGWDHFQRGQLDQAEACLRRALALRLNDAQVCNNLGVVLAGQGRHAEALARFDEAASLRPTYARAHHNRGNALRELGRLKEAAAAYEQALRLEPAGAEVATQLGLVLLALDRPADAVERFRQALKARPDHAEAQHQLGRALAAQGQLAEAEACYRQLLDRRPQLAATHHQLGVVLAEQGRHAEAVACYRRALELRPGHAECHNSLGFALSQEGDLGGAVAAFREALRLRPGYAEAHNNLGITLARQGDLRAAQAAFAEAVRLRPNYAKARTNRALAWLQQGDFARGWPEYEWRWRTQDFVRRPSRQPGWDGRPLAGRTILLHTEQGLGDTLQFIRYAPLVRGRGGVVLVEAPPRLLPLLRRCPGIDGLLPRGGPLPAFDVHAPLLSLPGLFHTTAETAPASVPYLSAEPELVERWGAELAAVPGFKIGIAWQGSTGYRDDRQRSIPLARFEPVARLEGVRLVSVQKGPGAEQLAAVRDWGVLDLGPRLDEGAGAFLDTAAVLTQLDLVITSDTSVAHLAGALGVPVWVALPYASDWRWLVGREDTPWYPTMRLFRQRRWGDWGEVFARVAAAVRRRQRSAALYRPLVAEVSPGELLDKITILEIKRSRVREPGPLAHVCTELGALLAARARALREPAAVRELVGALKGVNEALWEVEDGLRRCEQEGEFGPRFVDLARSVYRHNDERARLKRRINALCGSALVEEKAYSGPGPGRGEQAGS